MTDDECWHCVCGVTRVTMNKLLRRLRYNIRPSRSIEYTGCNAINLGDQAVFQAIDRTFPGVTVAYPKHPDGQLGRFLFQWECRHRRLASMLGGGTMIGAPPSSTGYVDRFEVSVKRTGRGFTFGTGVAELSFPPDHEAFVEDPSTYLKWANVLKECQYVSVRGPRSQAALAKLGVA